MSDWSAPPELNQLMPRQTRPNSALKVLLALPFVQLAIMAAFFAFAIYPIYHKAEVLKARGIDAQASVIKTWTSRGRGGTTYHLDYRYALDGSSSSYAAGGTTNAAHYREAYIGEPVPIIYDPSSPDVSALNFGNSARTGDPNAQLRFIAILIVAVNVLVYGILIPLQLRTYYRERALIWQGRTAAATITNQREYAARNGRLMDATYQFVDAQGKTIGGTRKGLSIGNKRNREKVQAILANPTVLYDPDDSSKNILYPASLVDCVAPQGPL